MAYHGDYICQSIRPKIYICRRFLVQIVFLFDFNRNGLNIDPKRSGMSPDHSQTLLGHFREKSFFVQNVDLSNIFFCKSQPHMAALAEVLEAKCSYFDSLSFMCSPQPAQHITFYCKMLIFSIPFSEKALCHLEPSLN